MNEKKADTTSAKYFFDLPFKATIPDRSEWSSNLIIAEENDLNWFTDGSKTREVSGFDNSLSS